MNAPGPVVMLDEPATDLALVDDQRSTALAVHQPSQPVVLTLVERAMDRGATLEQMRVIVALQERMEANEARKAFVKAKAGFKAENVVVRKDRENKQYDSRYTSIGAYVDTVAPVLAKHGLSADWKTHQTPGFVEVTCILSHDMGHSDSTSVTLPLDEPAAADQERDHLREGHHARIGLRARLHRGEPRRRRQRRSRR